MPRVLRALAVTATLIAAACVASIRGGETAERPRAVDDGGRVVRIALLSGVPRVMISATGDWRLYDSGGESVLLRAGSGDEWTVERSGAFVRAVRLDGVPTATRPAPFIARTVEQGAFVTINGKRYRGEVSIIPRDTGLLVVNRLYVEDYLRGVVPLEMGPRTVEEDDAVAAQAVAARSYTYVRLQKDAARPYDMVATVMDQAYGGVNAETPIADAAVVATAGLVITYGGRVVNAPYHSTCGGSTAEVRDVWHRSSNEPYLQRVSDRIPGTDRYYCDSSPRFRWTQTFDRNALTAALERYLPAYVAASQSEVGVPRSLSVDAFTSSGRVVGLTVTTDRSRYVLQGNDIRSVMRPPGGEILNSTYFSIASGLDETGMLASVTFTGGGYGHGIGMCQWGAIGRARAGQDFRAILRTYYPGTTVAPVD